MRLRKILAAGASALVMALTFGVAQASYAEDGSSPVILAPVDGSSSNVPDPEFSGTAAPNQELVLIEKYENGAEFVDFFSANEQGIWSIRPVLGSGTHTLYVTVYGKPLASNLVTISIDVAAPDRPTITSPSDETVLDTATFELTGTGEPGTTAVLSSNGDEVGTAPVDEEGHWNAVAGPFANGTHQIEVRLHDAVGNVGLPARVNVLVQVPEAPETIAPMITSPTQGEIVRDTHPLIEGTGTPGDRVRVLIDGENAGEAEIAQGGTWKLKVVAPLSEGTHTAQAENAQTEVSTRASSAVVEFQVSLDQSGNPQGGPGAGSDANADAGGGSSTGGANGAGGSGTGAAGGAEGRTTPELATTGSARLSPTIIAAGLALILSGAAVGAIALRRRGSRIS